MNNKIPALDGGQIHTSQYSVDGSPALQTFSLEGEPIRRLTFFAEGRPAGYLFIKHWAESEGIPQRMLEDGLLHPEYLVCGGTQFVGYRAYRPKDVLRDALLLAGHKEFDMSEEVARVLWEDRA